VLDVFPGLVEKMNKKTKKKLFSDFMISQSCLNLMCSVIQFFVLVVVTAVCAAL
jgi:hypothetical protein